MASKSAKSYRLGVRVPLKGREDAPPAPRPCKVTHTYFPTPDEALGLGWSPAQIMAGCRRLPKEDLTVELKRRLVAAGLTEKQVTELYKFSQAKIRATRSTDYWEKIGAETEIGGDDMGAAIKLASLKEAEQFGIKLPDVREENDEMGDLISFAKALVIGMPPREALEKCLTSRLKDITKELLQACVDGGLTRDEIAKGFGTTMSSLVWKASKVNYKFPDGRKRGGNDSADQPNNEIAGAYKAAALTGTPPIPEPGGAPSGGPQPDPKPASDEWDFTFGEGRKESGPELAIYSDGRIMIRRVELPVDTQYLFRFNRDFTKCRIESSPEGVKVHWKGTEGIESRIRPLANQFHKLGMKFTVRYRLDPATLIGERVGADAAVQA